MKRVILLVAFMGLSTFAFSQTKANVDKEEAKYVEVGVDENNPNDYRTLEIKDFDGKKAKIKLKKHKFDKGAITKDSKIVRAYNTEDLKRRIEENKEEYSVQSLYEENDVYFILFQKRKN